jgi:hypothetical protein
MLLSQQYNNAFRAWNFVAYFLFANFSTNEPSKYLFVDICRATISAHLKSENIIKGIAETHNTQSFQQ